MRKEKLRVFESRVKLLSEDSVHGATYLTLEAARTLEEFIENGADIDDIRGVALKIAEARPMMASIFRLANDLLIQLDDTQSVDEALLFIDRFVRETKVSAERVNRLAAKLVARADTVITHSFSSLVKDTVLKAAESNPSLRIVCTESRPKNEGVILAQTLCEAGVDAVLVTDAAMGYICREADMLLLGADGIGQFGLVHKIGTYQTVLAARENGVYTVVLAGKQKFWPIALENVKESPKSSEEIAGEGCFDVLNLYFDKTPLGYIDSIVTEKGVLKPQEALQLNEEIPLHPLLRSK